MHTSQVQEESLLQLSGSQFTSVWFKLLGFRVVLGGSWVVISRVINPVIWVITIVTPLITTHEPPSRVSAFRRFMALALRP